MRILSLILAFGMAAGAAQSATLDFSGNICGGGNACINGAKIDQSYGDIVGQVDVIYDGNRTTAALESLIYFSTNMLSSLHSSTGTDRSKL